MKKTLFFAALAAAALAMPGLAMADDAMGHDATAAQKMATMVCRPATAKEKPNVMMMDAAKTGMVCKPISMEMMKKGSGPNLSHALTAEQVDAAWREFIQSAVSIPGGTGGG